MDDQKGVSKTGKQPSIIKDALFSHIEISVVESEKRTNSLLNVREHYTAYLIETKLTDPAFSNKIKSLTTVWRRYTEFELLRNYLQISYPYIIIPPLPEKKVMYSWQNVSTDTFDPDFVDRRRAGLENFLLRVASHSVLSWDKHFLEFLQYEGVWKESHIFNGLLQKAEDTLQSWSVVSHPKSSNVVFADTLIYSNKLHTILSNLLKTRSRVAEKQYIIYKLHSNYGRIFSEWSAVEKEMGDPLQKTGHYLDSLASSIDSVLEDEELLVDQLKEYLFYASALGTVCKSYEALKVKVESAESLVSNKNEERAKILQGKTGLMSRLFGATDSEEVREMKVNLLDKEIEEANRNVMKSKETLDDFSEKAIVDIHRFQKQKVLDLKDTLMAYSVLQLKIAKKGLQTWTQIRDCLQNTG